MPEFNELLADVLPRFGEAEQKRLSCPDRQRAIGGGRQFEMSPVDQILMTVVWLRRYPTHEVLGYLFGVSDSTPSRYIKRVLPLLEASGRDGMRMPRVGRRGQPLDKLLSETPELAVVIDSFDQRVQRPKKRAEADEYYSGKKKQHTLKSQVAVDEYTGQIVDIAPSVRGPTHDMVLLRESDLLNRLPEGVGALGDLAYTGIAALHPQGLGAAPRKKPRKKERPVADIAFNTAIARRRIVVENTIGRLRLYHSLTQTDRQHRQGHTARVRAVAGLVNLQIRCRFVH
jgi:hypothetical protein